MCAALAVLIKRRFDWFGAIRENVWLVVLVAFMLISVLWSDIPNTSFIRWTREFQAVLMAFLVLSEPFPRESMQSILRRTTYILVPYSFLLIRYFPAYGRIYSRWSGELQWIGVTMQKNGLGRLCLIAAFYLLWSLTRRWRGHYSQVAKYETPAEVLILAITLWMFKGPGGYSFSATAMGAAVFGLLTLIALSMARRRKLKIKAGILITIVGFIYVFGVATVFTEGTAVGALAPSMGRNSTLTDRTEVWKSLLPVAMQRPILGSGVGAFWTPQKRELFQISEGHSGYLDVLLSLGFAGLLLLSGFVLSTCRKAHAELSIDYDWGMLWICYLPMFLLHNITESSIDTLTNHFTAVILFLSISSTSVVSRTQQTQSYPDTPGKPGMV